MNRINKYQDGIVKFIKTKQIIENMTSKTQEILYNLLKTSDNIPSILCLTVLNKQCQKNNITVHGYYLATGIELIMLLAIVASNREYYETIYGSITIDNMYIEVIGAFYNCLSNNIDTLSISNNKQYNTSRLTQYCIEYASKYISYITEKCIYDTKDCMKKTDILCLHLNKHTYGLYKKKYKLPKNIINANIINRYGAVCKMAIIFGWIFGQNYNILNNLKNENKIYQLEKHGNIIGTVLKLYDDFKNIDRDIKYGTYSLNHIVNYGIKDTYTELVNSKIIYVEGLMKYDIDTKTSKELIDNIMDTVDNIVKDISVDMNTQYDDISANI
jgi:hypothetical protein